MRILVINDQFDNNNVIAISPEIAKKYIKDGHEVFIQNNIGINSGWNNNDFENCKVIDNSDFNNIDILLTSCPLNNETISKLNKNTIVIGALDPYWNKEQVEYLCKQGITSFSLDLIVRSTKAQYIDIISSQANLAGYKAVIEASHYLNRAIPLMITTAGTIPAAKFLIVGAGVAGLQAIATARRLGAKVSAFDVRQSAKEQVESLGAKFIEVQDPNKQDGVYAKEMSDDYKKAQKMKLMEVLPSQDVVITTAQIPGKKAPIILTADLIKTMKKDSIIVDLAFKRGGNCEVIDSNYPLILGFDNILNLIPKDASILLSKNIYAFFKYIESYIINNTDVNSIDDEIIKSTLLTYNGELKYKF